MRKETKDLIQKYLLHDQKIHARDIRSILECETELLNKQIDKLKAETTITYRGYTIQKDWRNPYSKAPEYMFYPTEEGIQHDGDLVGEDMVYCGNCQWASSIEEAVDTIYELQNVKS